MISKTVRLAVLACVLAGAQPTVGEAQTSGRLERPVQASATGADGKLEVSPDATFGNLVVDQYQALGRKAAGPDANPTVASMMTDLMCSRGSIGSVSAYAVAEALEGKGKAQRARLKARDPEAMTDLAIGAIAVLDKVDADAITADEAIGPGAYHDAIRGMRFALEACKFFGQKL
jgi:hypothetical protein